MTPCAAVAQHAVANGATPLVADPLPVEAPADRPAPAILVPNATPDAPLPAATEPALPDIENTPLGSAPPRAGNLVAREDIGGGGSWVLSTLAALGLVIALILLLRWGWVKMGGGLIARSTPAVEVLSRTSVAPRAHVLLVRVGGRILVVADSTGGLRTLANVEDPDEVANLLESVTAARATSATRSFSQILSANDSGFEDAAMPSREAEDAGFGRARDSVSSLLARVRSLSEKGGGR